MASASKSHERSALWKRAYPDPLKRREEALLERRPWEDKDTLHDEHAKEPSLERRARVGVALSGGGIRSATFGFGVIQAWAKTKEGEAPEGAREAEDARKDRRALDGVGRRLHRELDQPALC